MAAVREFRPHVHLTYDDDGGYPHPDHIMTTGSRWRPFEAAGDPRPLTPAPVAPGSP
ncbi:hypothetical protein GCM10017559_47420 [Streptosporangium longisporum]|uniref:Uncharacterized protein n=1 Tax=Streptosporangium longisporum TaxID=46187 RepID=A0ABP6KQ62_9ACTN